MGAEIWTYNGFDLISKGKWGVEKVLEGVGIPGFRGSNLQVPFQDGTVWVKKKYDRRKVILAMWVSRTSRQDLDANLDTLLKVFGMRGQHTLQRTMRSGSVRRATAEVIGNLNIVTKNPGVAKFALEFELADPFFYGTTKVQTEKTISSSPYSWSETNAGSAPAMDVTISLEGPLTNPKITNNQNGLWLMYNGVINNGETVVLSTKDFLAIKGSASVISAITHGGDAQWFRLESGSNSISVESEATGGKVDIDYFPAYF